MASERVACKSCGQWMFHLAQRCPHCGAPHEVPETKQPGLTLSSDEARALLSVENLKSDVRRLTFADVAAGIVMPREGTLELVLSILAGPLTAVTVLTLGYLLSRQKRSTRDDGLAGTRLLAVPVVSVLMATTLFQYDAPTWSYAALGITLAAWAGREVRRSLRKRDPLL